MKTVIWSKDNCPYCIQAKKMLTESKIKFEEKNISQNPELRDELISILDSIAPEKPKTVPQIWIYGEYVGNYNDLCQYYEDHNMFGNDELF